MNSNIDKYLSTLLSFAHCEKGRRRESDDYISLIHIPPEGPEEVFSLSFASLEPSLMVARFQETVWEYLAKSEEGSIELSPRVNVLQAEIANEHPVFEYIGSSLLKSCSSFCDGRPGMDYYLLMWQLDGYASVVECWEPHRRMASSWITLIGGMQALASQYEFAAKENDPVAV